MASTGRRGGTARRLAGACNCLAAGTLVATPGGSIAIETLKVGDLVLSKNEVTGEVAAKAVTGLVRPEPQPLYALSVTGLDGEAGSFHATAEHPWKVEGRGWIDTRDLRPDDRIDTATGADVVVKTVALTEKVAPTYNLEVADWHTFLVGPEQILVHNGCRQLLEKLAMQEARGNSSAVRIMQR